MEIQLHKFITSTLVILFILSGIVQPAVGLNHVTQSDPCAEYDAEIQRLTEENVELGDEAVRLSEEWNRAAQPIIDSDMPPFEKAEALGELQDYYLPQIQALNDQEMANAERISELVDEQAQCYAQGAPNEPQISDENEIPIGPSEDPSDRDGVIAGGAAPIESSDPETLLPGSPPEEFLAGFLEYVTEDLRNRLDPATYAALIKTLYDYISRGDLPGLIGMFGSGLWDGTIGGLWSSVQDYMAAVQTSNYRDAGRQVGKFISSAIATGMVVVGVTAGGMVAFKMLKNPSKSLSKLERLPRPEPKLGREYTKGQDTAMKRIVKDQSKSMWDRDYMPPDFYVSRKGTAIPGSQSRMIEGFEQAGIKSVDAIKPRKPGSNRPPEKGRIYTNVPGKEGNVDIRIMEGQPGASSPHHVRRAVISHPGTNSPKTIDGTTPKTKHMESSHIRQKK